MAKLIVLLRGINVGGHHRIQMADLRGMAEAVGATQAATYIQSGNLVVETGQSAGRYRQALVDEFGNNFRWVPQMMVMALGTYRKVLDACPYRAEGAADPKAVHVYFLEKAPTAAAQKAVDALPRVDEQTTLAKHALYLWSPGGIGKSTMVKGLDKALGVAATARNWRSCQKILDLAEGL